MNNREYRNEGTGTGMMVWAYTNRDILGRFETCPYTIVIDDRGLQARHGVCLKTTDGINDGVAGTPCR